MPEQPTGLVAHRCRVPLGRHAFDPRSGEALTASGPMRHRMLASPISYSSNEARATRPRSDNFVRLGSAENARSSFVKT